MNNRPNGRKTGPSLISAMADQGSSASLIRRTQAEPSPEVEYLAPRFALHQLRPLSRQCMLSLKPEALHEKHVAIYSRESSTTHDSGKQHVTPIVPPPAVRSRASRV
jgi:hypothetical protein